MILVLSTYFYISHTYWAYDGETKKFNPITPAMYKNIMHTMIGYGVGIAFAALFYREACGTAGRGILAGDEGIEIIDIYGEDEENINRNMGVNILFIIL